MKKKTCIGELEVLLESCNMDSKGKQSLLDKMRRIVLVDSETGFVSINTYVVDDIQRIFLLHDEKL